MKSYQTVYRDINFRSRLEAKWAAFFDNLGWHWEYEPFDCGGWIPDFLLLGKMPALVEVKPIVEFDPVVAAEMDRAGAGDKFQLLLAGCAVPASSMSGYEADILGWTRETGDTGYSWGDAVIARWHGQKRLGWCHCEGWFADRISGAYDGGSWGDGSAVADEIDAAWAAAANATQWRRHG